MNDTQVPENETAAAPIPPPTPPPPPRIERKPVPAVDNRDRRDPSATGAVMTELRRMHPTMPMSQLVDMYDDELAKVAEYDPAPVDHAADRERELRERAGGGDKFAQALLDGDTLAEDPVD